MPKFVIVDGLIAAGKSTLLKVLEESFPKSKVIYEPSKHWEETGNLERFYKALSLQDAENRSAQIYRFQTYVFQTRIKEILNVLESSNVNNIDFYFIERSIFSDRYIFMEMLYESGMVTESDYEMYKTWWELWEKILPFKPDYFIYLNPSVSETLARHKIRDRKGEIIDQNYQNRLKAKHEQFFENLEINEKKIKYLNLDCDLDFREGVGKIIVLNKISEFVGEDNSNSNSLHDNKLRIYTGKKLENKSSEGNRYIKDDML